MMRGRSASECMIAFVPMKRTYMLAHIVVIVTLREEGI